MHKLTHMYTHTHTKAIVMFSYICIHVLYMFGARMIYGLQIKLSTCSYVT